MNRFIVVVLIAVTGLLVIGGLLFAERNPAKQKPRDSIVMIEPQHKAQNKLKTLRSMPSLTPDPKIDYKIQRMVIDDSIDYKIRKIGSRKPLPDDLKTKRRIFRPFDFRFPKSTLNLNNGTPGKAAKTPLGTQQKNSPHNLPKILKQND